MGIQEVAMSLEVYTSVAGTMQINGRQIGPGHPTYIIAELSCNHNGNLDEALKIVHAAAECGCDALKLQTYTADTITMDCDNEHFLLTDGLWKGRRLHELYVEASTPWEWHEKIFDEARKLGMDAFSSPFDDTAVDFL